jgi:hypothetical protein
MEVFHCQRCRTRLNVAGMESVFQDSQRNYMFAHGSGVLGGSKIDDSFVVLEGERRPAGGNQGDLPVNENRDT